MSKMRMMTFFCQNVSPLQHYPSLQITMQQGGDYKKKGQILLSAAMYLYIMEIFNLLSQLNKSFAAEDNICTI